MDAETAKLIIDLQHRVRVLEDKDALRTVLNKYCQACDTADIPLLNTVFAEDGTAESVAFDIIRGRATFAQGVASGTTFKGGLMHSITNLQFDINGSDTATATAYLSFYATLDASKRHETFSFGGPYEFGFRRNDKGDWMITRMYIGRLWENGEDKLGAFALK